MSQIKLGKYRHYKGTVVEVIGVALHSETQEELVAYWHPDPVKGRGANTLWVRPLAMFCEDVVVGEKKMPRFEYLEK